MLFRAGLPFWSVCTPWGMDGLSNACSAGGLHARYLVKNSGVHIGVLKPQRTAESTLRQHFFLSSQYSNQASANTSRRWSQDRNLVGVRSQYFYAVRVPGHKQETFHA